MGRHWIWSVLKFVLLLAAAFLLFSYAVLFLWNWLIPDIFNGPHITIGEAMGILALSKILFSSFNMGWGNRCGNHCRKSHWKSKFQEKWKDKYCNEDDLTDH